MAAAVASGMRRRDDDAFFSVFSKKTFTTPTPEATPRIGILSSPAQNTRSWTSTSFDDVNNPIVLSRAWSIATRFLVLDHGPNPGRANLHKDVLDAVVLILQSVSSRKDLVAWYANEISGHFRQFVLPSLHAWASPIAVSDAPAVLRATLDLLRQARQLYIERLDGLVDRSRHGPSAAAFVEFRAQVERKLHTLTLHSLPRQRLQTTLSMVMFQHLEQSLQAGENFEKCFKDAQCHCQLSVDGLPLEELHDVGLGDMLGEQAFAHAIHRFLQGSAIQRRCFQVDWTGHASVVTKLRTWVERNLAPVIERALGRITGDARLRLPLTDVHRFVALAVSNLGRSRTLNLFDYIKAWPASMGAILDIREYLGAGGQAAKAHVCHSFSEQIQKRLLHAGASTAEVLSIYVNVIHAFKTLDSRGVLLEKVAVPIRNYLRGREDTVSIIAASFLADVDLENNVSSSDMDKVCPDITVEVANSTLEDNRENKMLNWDDMEWTPDPIDAGPNYKSSKTEDVIAYILGLFEQEEFIKEVTAVLAQHLLHGTDAEFVKETRLVELFKSRLDASKLQAAEVMLKDVRDSVTLGKRINPRAVYDNASTRAPPPTPREIQAAIPEDGITLPALFKMFEGRMKSTQFVATVKLVSNRRNDLIFPKRTRVPPDASGTAAGGRREGEVDFKAQILSSFFWPQLRSNEFLLPASLSQYCKDFEDRFHALGSQRRLHFRPALARVSLKLELEDRVVQETDVAAWRASVIDLFTRNDSTQQNHDEPIHLDVETITTTLNMEEDLVHDALTFWLNKKVLYQASEGTYAVLERLDMDVAASSQAAPSLPQQQEEAMSAVVSQGAMLRESAAMFEVFIANMLRNQGAKAIGGMMGITNLLKMVLPGFTYGDDEVAWLLGEMEGRGEVVRNGELWSVA